MSQNATGLAPGVFNETRILDFTQVIAGSFATTLMGDMGAEVVKVEPPYTGDTLRFAGPVHNGESGFFLLNNRNKKSISVNLKHPDGVRLIKELIPHFDVVTENFKPGVMEKLGLGYEAVKAVKSDIIYVSVSGYGHKNRYSHRAAYDNIIQCESGLASLNGLPDPGSPLRSPLSISDYTAGLYSAFAMASAIYHLKNTGVGQYIDIAMLDSLISIMDNSFLIYDLKGGSDMNKLGLRSTGNRHPGAAPHGFYATKDGHIAHMSLTNKMWHGLLRIIGQEGLIDDPRYATLDQRKECWQEIDELIETWTKQHTTEDVLAVLKENRLPCGKVRCIDEVYDDPHCKERGIFHELEHPVAGKMRITNTPIKATQTPPNIHSPSPLLGQHTRKVINELLGYSREEIDSFREAGVLFMEPHALALDEQE